MNLKTSHKPDVIRRKLFESSEFKKSESTSYGSQLKYRQSLNKLYIENGSNNTIFISENAGHGGLGEVMTSLSIKSNPSGSELNFRFKTGGLPFHWLVYLFSTLAIASLGLIALNYYFILLTIGLISISILAKTSNDKIRGKIISKVAKVLD